jgi:hypothetical protein
VGNAAASPLVDGEEDDRSEESPSTVAPTALIVDDEKNIRLTLEMVRGCGYGVVQARARKTPRGSEEAEPSGRFRHLDLKLPE